MEMLRQWNGESNELLIQHLQQFGVDAKELRLVKYEELSPDSFIWYLLVKEKDAVLANKYCLYAEDYIPSLAHVLDVVDKNVPTWQKEINHKYDGFLRVIKPVSWNKADPVRNASVYQPPEKDDDFMDYAYPSGYDFVFLVK